MSAHLRAIEGLWREQGMNAEMPLELYESITEGADGFDKRIVRNLAMHSVLIDEQGSIYGWRDILNQWEYVRCSIGEYEQCDACRRSPIIDNCILRNRISEHEIVVGNRCVLRYLSITIEGDDENQKSKFLSDQFRILKNQERAKEFKFKHPTFWRDLKSYEDILNIYRKPLLKAMIKRMRDYGFLSNQMLIEWSEFLEQADSLVMKHQNDEQIKNERYNALREQQNRIAIKRQGELNSLRLRRREIANSIIDEIDALKEYASDSEIESLTDMLSKVRLGGLPDNKMATLYESLKRRQAVHESASDFDDEEQAWLHALDKSKLTKAERIFRYQTIAKQRISNSDRSTIRRMRQRYG